MNARKKKHVGEGKKKKTKDDTGKKCWKEM